MNRGITMATAKKVLWEMYKTGRDAHSIIEEQDLWQIDDIPTLEKIIEDVIAANLKAVTDYKGKNG